MGSEQFARAFREERDALFASYCGYVTGAAVATLLDAAALSQKVLETIDSALADTFYTVLLALDGSASPGSGRRQGPRKKLSITTSK